MHLSPRGRNTDCVEGLPELLLRIAPRRVLLTTAVIVESANAGTGGRIAIWGFSVMTVAFVRRNRLLTLREHRGLWQRKRCAGDWVRLNCSFDPVSPTLPDTLTQFSGKSES